MPGASWSSVIARFCSPLDPTSMQGPTPVSEHEMPAFSIAVVQHESSPPGRFPQPGPGVFVTETAAAAAAASPRVSLGVFSACAHFYKYPPVSIEVTKGALLRTFCGASSFYRGLAVLVPQYPPPSRLWRRPPHWHADSLLGSPTKKCRQKRLQRSVPQRFRVGCWLLPPGKLSIVSLGSVEQGLHAQVTDEIYKEVCWRVDCCTYLHTSRTARRNTHPHPRCQKCRIRSCLMVATVGREHTYM